MPASRRTNLLVLLLLVALVAIPVASSTYEDDEYVQEVLEEDYRNDEDYYGDSHTTPEEEYERRRQQQAEQEELFHQEQLREEERLNQKIAQEREAKFESELRKASEEKQKALKQQKKRDAKIVRSVLKAAAREDHYGVLGIRNMELAIGPRTIGIPFTSKTFEIHFKLFQMNSSKIKRAYRSRAMAVHPDKNRDGRANEAFMAVENSASILSDSKLRKEHDQEIRLRQKEQRQRVTQFLVVGTERVVGSVGKGVGIFRNVLGPFAFPVAILGALLI